MGDVSLLHPLLQHRRSSDAGPGAEPRAATDSTIVPDAVIQALAPNPSLLVQLPQFSEHLRRLTKLASWAASTWAASSSALPWASTHRIILQSNLASVETPDETVFTVCHELKHYVMHDAWKGLAIIAAFLLAGFWLTDRLGHAAIRRFSPRWGFSKLSDPASLPLMVFLLIVFFWLAFVPFFNLIGRHIEHEADRFGLELTHQNYAMAMVFAEDVQKRNIAPDWYTFFLIFQANHPSIAQRIQFANTYKPWKQGKPLVYAHVCQSELISR